MRIFQNLLFVLKRSFICYNIICMTVPLTKLKYIFNQYTSYEEMKVTSSSAISKAIHHMVCHLCLFGKRKLQSFETYMNNLSYIAISTFIF